MRVRGLLLGVALLAVATLPVGADSPNAIDLKEQELDDLRVRIKHHQRKAKGLAHDERQELEQLADIEKELQLTAELLDKLSNREIDVQLEMQTSKVAVDSVEALVDGRQERLAARLRTIYKRPRVAGVAAILGAGSLRGLATRIKVITHIARTEQRVIDETKTLQNDFVREQVRWDNAMSQLQSMREEAERRRLQLAQLEEDRKAALTRIRKERRGYEASVKEMEAAAEELSELIDKLLSRAIETAPAPSTNFAQRQGTLPWPLHGPILRPYGESIHPEFQTVVVNKGINIGAPVGSPIRAVADGVVDYVNWLPGYGKCLIVSHGDGYYTLYAHASELFPQEGQQVLAGETVGEVGDSGSLEGSQLYFEVRNGKEPLDPNLWLSQPAR